MITKTNIHLRSVSFLTFLSVCFGTIASCTDLSDVKKDIDALEERVEDLEKMADRINNNSIALKILYQENTLILELIEREHGYGLVLSDRDTLDITFGSELPGIAPIIGIDSKGEWIISTDGGETFSPVAGAAHPSPENGITPIVAVDEAGFWIISCDNSQTFNRILGENGLPISAKDGKTTAGQYSFFSDVRYNEAEDRLDMKLLTGETLSVPVQPRFGVEVVGYKGNEYVLAGKERTWPCRLDGVKEAVWQNVPDGWRACLDADRMTVTAPENGEPGTYAFKLIVFSDKGFARSYTYSFNYDPLLILRDDFDGDVLDTRIWSIYKKDPNPAHQADWDHYQDGDPAQTFLENGYLVLKGEKSGDTYKTGAVTTKDKVEYRSPCRIDISARFTRTAKGVWFALWTLSNRGYYHGEIDMMEKVNDGSVIYHTVHNQYTLSTPHGLLDYPNQGTSNCNIGQFNTYSVEIDDENVVFFLNGTETFRYKNMHHADEETLPQFPYGKETLYLIMNIAIGGDWTGPPVDSELPGQMDVDWVQIKKMNP